MLSWDTVVFLKSKTKYFIYGNLNLAVRLLWNNRLLIKMLVPNEFVDYGLCESAIGFVLELHVYEVYTWPNGFF